MQVEVLLFYERIYFKMIYLQYSIAIPVDINVYLSIHYVMIICTKFYLCVVKEVSRANHQQEGAVKSIGSNALMFKCEFVTSFLSCC